MCIERERQTGLYIYIQVKCLYTYFSHIKFLFWSLKCASSFQTASQSSCCRSFGLALTWLLDFFLRFRLQNTTNSIVKDIPTLNQPLISCNAAKSQKKCFPKKQGDWTHSTVWGMCLFWLKTIKSDWAERTWACWPGGKDMKLKRCLFLRILNWSQTLAFLKRRLKHLNLPRSKEKNVSLLYWDRVQGR